MTTYQLCYTLTLQSGAVIATRAEDPNLVSSDGSIPGSNIMGAAAAAYIERIIGSGKAHHDNQFVSWFLRDGLRFLPAYPVDTTDINFPVRMLPAPLSVFKQKSQPGTVYDLSDSYSLCSVQEQNIQLLGLSGYVRQSERSFVTYEPKRTMAYHNARPNRLKGHADDGEGGVFVYESLQAGQSFMGYILGSKEDLIKFIDVTGWTGESTVLNIGRSVSAEYGGKALLKWKYPLPKAFTREPEGISQDAKPDRLNQIVVTLLSPMIVRDSGGRFIPSFSHNGFLHALSMALKGSGLTPIRVNRAYCRQTIVGGYVRAWNLPRPQCAALAAGSVLVVDVEGDPDPSYAWVDAEQQSLGLRTGEGFGRFVIDWHTPLRINTTQKLLPPNITRPANLGAVQEKLTVIYKATRLRILLDAAASLGRDDGSNEMQEVLSQISPAQLGRLIHTLRGTDGMRHLKTLLEGVRVPAQEQMRAVRIAGQNKRSLWDVLHHPQLTSRIVHKVPQHSQVLHDELQVPDIDALDETVQEYNRVYLLNLCVQMSRHKRHANALRKGKL